MLLRLLCAQVFRSKPDLAPFVYENYVKLCTTASLKRIRELLKLFFESLGTTFLVLDGLDEYDSSEQTNIIDELSRLLKVNEESTWDDDLRPKVKLMICSRETKDILRYIRKKMNNLLVVSLSEEVNKVSGDIAKFTRANLLELRDRFDDGEVDKVGDNIAEKADGESSFTITQKRLTFVVIGMFLWVRLVLGIVQEQWSLADLRTAVNQLPKGLNGV
jgi:hypothetical protein